MPKLKYYNAPNSGIEKLVFNKIYILPISVNFPQEKIAIGRDDIIKNRVAYLGYVENLEASIKE